LAKLGVEIEFNREVTPDYVAQKNPEAVILATGATPIIPDIPGVKGTNVVQANDVLMGKAKTGKRVAVVGGGLVGIETAEFLAQMGKTVTIIEMLEKIAADVNLTQMLAYRDSIKELGIYTYTKTKVTEITGNGVLANMENELIFFEADTVVLAVGSRPNDFLAQKLSGLVPKVIAVGDCVRARRIIDAIHEGFHAAREI
jgi:pyruvate/2-oxoglutarate dehydrogenase complex dihydrolipoamide dehydrogenase (E3) component